MTQFANVKHHFKFNLLMRLRFGSYHPDILLMVKFMVAIVIRYTSYSVAFVLGCYLKEKTPKGCLERQLLTFNF